MPTLTPLVPSDTGASILAGRIFDWSRGASIWARGEEFGVAPGGSPDGMGSWINETITSAVASGDTAIGPNVTSGIISTVQIPVSDPNTDFLSMDTLSLNVSTVIHGTPVNDPLTCKAMVMTGDGVTTLAGASSSTTGWVNLHEFTSAGSWATVQPAYNQNRAFAYVNTAATKAQWDNARLRFQFSNSSNMGGDGTSIIVVDARLTGTYTASAPPAEADHIFLGDTQVLALKVGDLNVPYAYVGDKQIFPFGA